MYVLVCFCLLFLNVYVCIYLCVFVDGIYCVYIRTYLHTAHTACTIYVFVHSLLKTIYQVDSYLITLDKNTANLQLVVTIALKVRDMI